MVRAMHSVAGSGRVVGGRYRLRDPIGRGAMGTVWRGRDELLDRDVAVKEVKVPPTLSPADRSSLYQRTLREAKTAARLNHPGVVTVFDVVEEDGRPWIVMELVQARSLERVLADDGPLPVPDAAGIGRQLVSALATAHAAGVLHRDVKPSNVLLAPDGRAVLTDFGIATFEGDERLTQTGMVMGTPEFTPPERIRGEPATPSSDLWSLGATLYAAVQGRGPYAARGDPITTMNAVLHEDAPAAPSAGRLRTCYLRADAQGSGGAARRRQGFDAAGGGAGEAAAPHGSRPGAGSGCRSTRRPRRPVLLVCPAVLVAGSPVLAGPARSVHLRRPGSRRAAKLRPHGHGSRAGRRGEPRPCRCARHPAQRTGGARCVRRPGDRRGRGSRRTCGRARPAPIAISRPGAPGRQPPATPARATGPGSTASPGGTAASPLPPGYAWYSRPAASVGTAAGFRLAVPQGWAASTNGLTAYLRASTGAAYLEIDLTPHTLPTAMAQARWLEARTLRQGKFPGYRRVAIRPVRVAGSTGATWSFTWQEADMGRVFAEDYLFDLATSSASQSYAVYASGPAASWRQTARILGEAIRTFQPLP